MNIVFEAILIFMLAFTSNWPPYHRSNLNYPVSSCHVVFNLSSFLLPSLILFLQAFTRDSVVFFFAIVTYFFIRFCH